MRKNIFFSVLFLLMSVLCGQAQVSFRGLVTDEGGTPLAGVNIRVDNSLTGGTTDGKGEFLITGLPEGTHTLNFSYVGYEPQKYKAEGSREAIRVIMRESYNRLSQVVVTGTGTHRRMADSPVPITVITAMPISTEIWANLQVRSLRRAPMLWPTRVVAALETPCPGM